MAASAKLRLTRAANRSYQNGYVAFLDILGFREAVDRSADKSENFANIQRALALVQEVALSAENKGRIKKAFAFSDSIVLIADDTLTALRYLFRTTEDITLRLLRIGLPIRGAIDYGQVHFAERLMFGPAINGAYDFERQLASVPRVVLTTACVGMLDKARKQSPTNLDLRYAYRRVDRDSDGVYYIDLKFRLLDLARKMDVDTANRVQLLEIRTAIRNGALSSIADPRTYAKYEWLAKKFNTSIPSDIAESQRISPINPGYFARPKRKKLLLSRRSK